MNLLTNIKSRYDLVKNHLNEKTKRLWCAAEAKVLNHGGIALVSKATKVARGTIARGLKELDSSDSSSETSQIRQKGGGRKKAIEKSPDIEKALFESLEPTVRGEPQSSLLWTTKSLRNLSNELKSKGIDASYVTVRDILKANNFSLQANRKVDEGSRHIDRNAQFEHIYNQVKRFQTLIILSFLLMQKRKNLLVILKTMVKNGT
jgi:hypothetical protein